MAWFKLEASARTHFKFNRLAEALRIHRAEARGLFFGMCAWASEAAPDGRLDGYTHRDIENGADWQGKPGRLVPALIDCGLLDRIDGTALEIHDFFERAASHKQAAKKRAQRDKLRTVPGPSPDCTPREDREDREERTETTRGPPPKLETLADTHAIQIPATEAAELYAHHQAEMQRVHGVAPVLMPPSTLVDQARPVLVNAGRDIALAKRVVTALVESKHPYWVDRRWALWLLGSPRDFEQARLSAPAAKKQKEDPLAKIHAMREEHEARMKARGGPDAPA